MICHRTNIFTRTCAGFLFATLTLLCASISLPPGVRAQQPTSLGNVHSAIPCLACQNFYQYANQSWLDTASIPASRSDWGAWSANDARVSNQLHSILQSAAIASRSASPPSERILGSYFASCMDSVRADADGVSPIRPVLAQIDSVTTPADIAREFGRLHRDGVTAVFALSSDVDRTASLHYVASIGPSRLTFGAQDYSSTDSASVRRRAMYRDHIVRTLTLAGEPAASARQDADGVLSIESVLAQASMSRTQEANASLEDFYRSYPFAKLRGLTPGFAWDAYLRERHAGSVSSVIISQPAFLTAFARLVTDRPVADWRGYLRWRVVSDASPYLSSAFADESFHYSQQTSGTKVQAPRWQRCTLQTGSDLPELLGRAYIAHTFSPSSKANIAGMVKEIRAVLVERLKTVPWLTAETRKQSLEKARTFGVKIAYPDKWHDYSALRITPGAFVSQRAEARRFESDRLISRIGTLPDRAEWDFHGQYYFVPQSPTAWANFDEIIFPAAYLQPPVYDSTADLATNYGGIGVVIAHEITHLFTADGGDIDASGRIRHWWTPTDSVRFAVIQNRLIHQYDQYTVVDSVTHVNGMLTLGENLADVGGVELAYAAMERATAAMARTRRGSRNGAGKAGDSTRDTMPEMRFFLSYAHSRVSKSRPEYLRQQVANDGHSPSMFRVNGPFSNFAPFAKAFGCKPGDAMVRPDSVRVQIW